MGSCSSPEENTKKPVHMRNKSLEAPVNALRLGYSKMKIVIYCQKKQESRPKILRFAFMNRIECVNAYQFKDLTNELLSFTEKMLIVYTDLESIDLMELSKNWRVKKQQQFSFLILLADFNSSIQLLKKAQDTHIKSKGIMVQGTAKQNNTHIIEKYLLRAQKNQIHIELEHTICHTGSSKLVTVLTGLRLLRTNDPQSKLTDIDGNIKRRQQESTLILKEEGIEYNICYSKNEKEQIEMREIVAKMPSGDVSMSQSYSFIYQDGMIVGIKP